MDLQRDERGSHSEKLQKMCAIPESMWELSHSLAATAVGQSLNPNRLVCSQSLPTAVTPVQFFTPEWLWWSWEPPCWCSPCLWSASLESVELLWGSQFPHFQCAIPTCHPILKTLVISLPLMSGVGGGDVGVWERSGEFKVEKQGILAKRWVICICIRILPHSKYWEIMNQI